MCDWSSDTYSKKVTQKKEMMGQIFVAFSEYLNLINSRHWFYNLTSNHYEKIVKADRSSEIV